MSDDPISPALCAVAEQHRVSLDAVYSLAAALRAAAPSGPSQLGVMLAAAVRRACQNDAASISAVAQSFAQSLGSASQLNFESDDDQPAKRARARIDDDQPAKRARIPEPDEETAAILLRNIRSFFAGPLATIGTRPAALQQKADTLAEALHSKDLVERRLVSSVERLTGMNRSQFQRGGHLQDDNAERPRADQHIGAQRAVRSDYVDLDWVWEWFHTKSDDVEPDKTVKWAYKRKRAFVAGKWRNLTCDMRILTCSKAEAVANFKKSPEYLAFARTHREIPNETISTCICCCMKPDKRDECACPICTSFLHKIKAWNQQRTQWHADGSCKCGLNCKDKTSAWRQASRGFAHFEQCLLCPRQPHGGLALPHSPNDPPEFYKICCCLQPRTRGRHYPDGIAPCQACGWTNRFGNRQCADEYNNSPATWKKLTEVPAGNGRTEKKFVEHTGTRAELLDEIEADAPAFLYHRWIRSWMKWQFKLDVATFDGKHEVLVLTDFAADYEMKGREVGTCEHGISCHQLMALVLHSPGPMARAEGEERPVICDYWRIWSNKKGDAAFHDKAMRDIAEHYRQGAVPQLQRLKVWSDGQRSQYKGRKNFGRMVEWPNPRGRPGDGAGMGVEIWHNFFASHHASGPQDNAGKDPRRAMDLAIIHNKTETIYSYWKCLRWCASNMSAPSADHKHAGTFGCNGEYIWKAYSDGTDENPDDHPVIDGRPRDWHPIEGSNELYSFRAWNTEPAEPEMELWFVPCYCRSCRAAQHSTCPFRHVTREASYDFVTSKAVAQRRRRAPRAAAAGSSDDDDE